eukprot:1184451-Prorocentrum_minimum.AAC.4
MASVLDKSLEEIIKERSSSKKSGSTKPSGRGGRGGRGDSGRGAGRGGGRGRSMAVPVRGKTIAKAARPVAVAARPKPAFTRIYIDSPTADAPLRMWP